VYLKISDKIAVVATYMAVGHDRYLTLKPGACLKQNVGRHRQASV